jgi:GT2 family glycosyltransferase
MDSGDLVSIVIVNYNAGDLLQSCLDSIFQQTYADWEVIIVDNHSQDKSLERITPNHQVRILYNNTNLGFATAQNQGFRAAHGPYLMSLNYDVRLTENFLQAAVAAIGLDPEIGSVTPKLLYMEEDGKLTDRIYAAGHLMPRNRFPLLRGTEEIDQGQYDQPELVFGAPGAAVIFRRDCLEDVAYQGQFFDESYFMWSEDVDLDWRIQLRGWKCLYAPQAVAAHIGHPQGYDPSFTRFQAAHSIYNRWAMITADEASRNIVKNLIPLTRYELSLLIYVLRSGLLSAYLKAGGRYLKDLPKILKKRHWVQSRSCLQSR